MSKELKTLLGYLLDKVDEDWKNNPELVEAYQSLTKTSKHFVPPTLDEVALELRKQKVRMPVQQAERFFNFYESKGWMIGKNKMKSWKAAIKTWNFEKDNIIL